MDEKHYRNHLTQVNKVSNVIATEDILNEQGQMVLPAGTLIDAKASTQIIRFKLLKPIEDSIAIDNQLNAESLFYEIEDAFLTDTSLQELWINTETKETIQRCCENATQFPIITQKLTVLAMQAPKLFKQGLVSAWFSANIYILNKANDEDTVNVFLAALTHDLGMLHLNPEFLDDERELSVEEWRQVQSHPLIGQIILKHITGIPEAVNKGVADHHESIDATGYPAGKISKQISTIGQILHLVDSVISIYYKHFQPRELSLHDLVPIIQMNQNYRQSEEASSLIVLLKRAEATSDCQTPAAYIDQLIQLVMDQNTYVLKFLQVTSELNKSLGYQHGIKKLLGLQNILLHIHICLTRSGIVNTAYMRWLSQVRQEKLAHAYREIEDVNLMLTEILHYCDKFKVSLQLLLEECKNTEVLKVLAEINAEVSRLPTPEIDVIKPDTGESAIA